MTKKNGGTIAGTSKSKLEKPANAKKTLQEILAADSVLSGSRYGTKKRKQKTETINSSDDDDVDKSKYVNCVSVEDFEKVRKAIKNYRSDIVINDKEISFIKIDVSELISLSFWGTNRRN